MQNIQDAHFSIERAQTIVSDALKLYIPHEKIDKIIAKYSPEVIRETGSQLQLSLYSSLKKKFRNTFD